MMGLDAGIIVLKQLVDQEKWTEVLHKIGEQCSDVPQFPINCNDYRSFTLQDLSVLKITEKFNFQGEHMFSGWLCDQSTDQFQLPSNCKNQVVRQNYFERLISACSYPPIAYFFDIGGFLCFPVFCRHFKSQVIRVTGHRPMVLEVLKTCYKILQEYFPDNVTFFQGMTSKDYNHGHVKCHQPEDAMN